MSDDELTRLEALCQGATEGPWVNVPITDSAGKPYATLYQTWTFIEPSVCGLWAAEGKDMANANFIAAARTGVPGLLATVRERDAEIARLRELIGKGD